ncbi:MAG: hypothetical protein V3U11_02635 [Planctomycetota bacterium]
MLALVGAGLMGWLTLGILTGDEALAMPLPLAAEQTSRASDLRDVLTVGREPLSNPPNDRVALRIGTEHTEEEDETRELSPERLKQLVMDLAHDNVRHNALWAIHFLRKAQQDAAPLLEKALRSRDRQQRQLSAYLLREFVKQPSDRLLEITVEGLHTDRIPYDSERWDSRGGGNMDPEMDNAVQGTRYLLDHTAQGRRFLLDGLFSQDPQQRFLCAFLVGQGGITEHLWCTCQTLIPHLADNSFRGDALMSAHALYGLGRPALPYVQHAMRYGDRQAVQLLSLIELDIVSPPQTSVELANRQQLQDITTVYADPVIQLNVRHMRFPTWELGENQPPLPPR